MILKFRFKYILLFFFCFLILLTSYFSYKSVVAECLRSGKRINGILLGTDIVDYSRHSDTIIFISYNPETKFVDLISIPRDTRNPLPDIKVSRINQLYAYYYRNTKDHKMASSAFTKVVSVLFKNRVDIKNYVQIDYKGFSKLIDSAGPIILEIEEPMDYDDYAGKLHIHFSTGIVLLDGKKALEYIRYRSLSGDIGRIYRQQRFIRAVIKKMNNPLFLLKLPSVVGTAIKTVNTNFSFWDILNIFIELRNIRLSNIRIAQLPGKPSGPVWNVDDVQLTHALDVIFGPKISTEQKIPTVEVLNASSHSGAALSVARKLRDLNFDVVDYRNSATRQKKTIIIDRVGKQDIARKIANILEVEEIFTRYDTTRMVDISVIIGEDYKDTETIDKKLKNLEKIK